MFDLKGHWHAMWAELGAKPDHTPALQVLLNDVCQRYREAQRRYHTLQHLTECLTLCVQERGLAENAAEVAIALWFHDAVYELTAHDNEAQSAEWARRSLTQFGIAPTVADRVHTLIMATRHQHLPSSPDEKLLVDIDLAILGAEPTRFAEYDKQIRAEYQHVPEALYREKRRAVLNAFLQRERIFSTAHFQQRYDAQARLNLRIAIS